MEDDDWDKAASSGFFNSGDLKGSGPSSRRFAMDNAKEAGTYKSKDGKMEYRVTDAAEAAETAAGARKRISDLVKFRAKKEQSKRPGKPSKNLQARVDAKYSRKESRQEADRMSDKKYRNDKKQEAFEAKAYGNGAHKKMAKGGKFKGKGRH